MLQSYLGFAFLLPLCFYSIFKVMVSPPWPRQLGTCTYVYSNSCTLGDFPGWKGARPYLGFLLNPYWRGFQNT